MNRERRNPSLYSSLTGRGRPPAFGFSWLLLGSRFSGGNEVIDLLGSDRAGGYGGGGQGRAQQD